MEDKAEILSLDNYGNVDTINKKIWKSRKRADCRWEEDYGFIFLNIAL